MTQGRAIAINGDLGSGKSTVSIELARRLNIRRISMGDIYRQMAQERGMTTLQLNLHSELDKAVDGHIDRIQREIGQSGEQLVLDSRLAWHFLVDAFKVHLITEPTEAAKRVLSRPSNEVESYASVDEAKKRLHQRSESERARFIARYGVDKCRLRNYDLVCDTTSMPPMEVTDLVIATFHGSLGKGILPGSPPLLLIDPKRTYPSQPVERLKDLRDADFVDAMAWRGPAGMEPLDMGYTGTHFYVLDGHRRLSAALQNHFPFIPARLVAERGEIVAGGLNAVEYFASEVTVGTIQDWQAAHGTELELPPHLRTDGD